MTWAERILELAIWWGVLIIALCLLWHLIVVVPERREELEDADPRSEPSVLDHTKTTTREAI